MQSRSWRRHNIKIVLIVERWEENQILHRISWLEGRGFRYLECSSILDIRTHLRNDMKKEKKDDNDNDGNDVFFERGNIYDHYVTLELESTNVN